jgi:hypothetical protein
MNCFQKKPRFLLLDPEKDCIVMRKLYQVNIGIEEAEQTFGKRGQQVSNKSHSTEKAMAELSFSK